MATVCRLILSLVGGDMGYLIVEKVFEQPLTEEEFVHVFSQLEPCLSQYRVRWIHSYLSKDRTRMICAFEAVDAESVRMAHRVAGVKFERVWPAQLLTVEAETER